MDIQEALKIMRALANGKNPENGEALEESTVCRQPQTVRATNRAISALVAEQGRETKRPRNAFRTCEAGEIGEDCAASCAAGIAAEGGLSRVYGFTGNHSNCDASAGSK